MALFVAKRVCRLPIAAALAVLVGLVSEHAVLAHDSGFGIVRYAPDGSLDRTFGNDGLVVTRSAQRSFAANALALQDDGRIVIGGMRTDVASASLQLAIARYNADGSPDASFAEGSLAATPVGQGGAEANAMALQPDGHIVVVGTAFAHGSGDDTFFAARYTQSGVLDSSFGTAGIATTHVGAAASAASAVAIQPDGRIVVVGTAFSNGASDDDFAVVRYTSAGQLDATFGNLGIVTTDFGPSGATATPSLDRGTSVALQPDGRIIAAGFTRGGHQTFAVARYLANGTADPTFGSSGKVQISLDEPQVFSVILQSTGNIIVAGISGSSTTGLSTAPFTLVRLTPRGAPDQLFGSGGVVTTAVDGSLSGARAVVAQPDGKLITGGAKFGAPGPQGDALPQSGYALARYNTDGSIDRAFGSDGKTLTDLGDAGATPLSLALQPDGKIVAAGLVFFQVPASRDAASAGPDPRLVVGAAAGTVLVALLLSAAVVWRRSTK